MIAFTQGDDAIIINLTAQDGSGNAIDISGATFETQILGASKSLVVIPNSQHTLVNASLGKFQFTMTAAQTLACAPGQTKDITTKIISGGKTIYYHGFGALSVYAEAPQA